MTGLIFAAAFATLLWRGAGLDLLGAFAAASLLFTTVTGIILRGATAMMFHVVESNEWSRFHIADLDSTIRDHVGEDKLQIVTFRDRNRIE